MVNCKESTIVSASTLAFPNQSGKKMVPSKYFIAEDFEIRLLIVVNTNEYDTPTRQQL